MDGAETSCRLIGERLNCREARTQNTCAKQGRKTPVHYGKRELVFRATFSSVSNFANILPKPRYKHAVREAVSLVLSIFYIPKTITLPPELLGAPVTPASQVRLGAAVTAPQTGGLSSEMTVSVL